MGPFLDVVIFLIAMAVYSLVITHFIPKKYYSFSNILIALGSIGYGLADGLRLSDMGLAWHSAARSIVIVGLLLLLISLVLSLAYLIPPLKRLMSDGPSKRFSRNEALNELLIRVPFGTALSEEIIFRCVLLGLLLQDTGHVQAVLISALAFGLWHILPTLQTVRANDAFKKIVGHAGRHHALSVLATVLATTAAGVTLAWLRLFAGNIIAPWLVHAFINGFAIGNAYVWLLVQRMRRAEGQQT